MLFFISRKKMEAEVARRAAETCERILQEMGADVHDNVKQHAFMCSMDAVALERSVKDPDLQSLLVRLKLNIERLLHAVGIATRKLSPSSSKDETLVTQLQTLCRNIDRPGMATIHFANNGEPVRLGDSTEIYILRMVQELIQNAFRHSYAWHIWVRIQWQPGRLIIEVEDDGSGFNRLEEFIGLLKKKHNSIKMRSNAIGASIKYKRGKKGLLAILRMKTTEHSPIKQE